MSNDNQSKTILILAANPTNTAPLRLEQEIREIDEGLRRANQREQYKLAQKWAVRSRDFYRAILDYKPQIVHFCGHGAGEEGIVLEDDTGKMALVETNALASMFKLFAKKGVECVILNACYSEVQAEAISQYVKYVVGMNKAVGDKAAVAFAVAFYDAIAAAYTVEEAYELGCSQMMSFREQETPVLKKQKNVINAPVGKGVIAFEDVIPPNPYQGLSAFGEEDADFFFGQENFVNNLVEIAHKQPLVAVVGPSGSGKSSVVFAGLIPKLRTEGNWLIESFRPGKEPFVQLASALVRQLEPTAGEIQQLRETMELAGDLRNGRIALRQVVSGILERHRGKKLLLVADQCEELFTLCQVKEERECFTNELLTAVTQENLTLVLTLRADFYGYALSYRPLRDALQEYMPQLLGAMQREELQATIELPAQKLEVQLEPHLTQRILNDVGEEPGNLPLLEFALTRLWEKQQNRKLTHQAYEEIGGVRKAIANHAKQVYQQLSETEKKQAQRIFVQLVRPGERNDISRIATRAEVGEDNWNLVSYLAGYPARLVVTGRQEQEDTVEVVHEALIREWGTLREWINANRQFRTWQERLKVALREWKNDNQDSGSLLRGIPLTVAEDWLRKRADELTQEERNFIQVSVKGRNRERQKKQRRRQLTIVGLSGFSVIALGLAGLAGVGWWRAAINQINSMAQHADALVKLDGTKALKISLKAVVEMQRTPWADADTRTQVELSLLNTVANVAAPNTLGGHAGSVNAVSVSPNGKLLTTGSDDSTVKLWDASTGKEITTLSGHTNAVWSVSFSPDGKLLATGSADRTVKLWDTATGKQITTLSGHTDSVYAVSFSPDGKLLATGSGDNTVKLWDTATGKEIKTLSGHTDWVKAVSFSPDGKRLVTGSGDRTVKLWDTATGKQITTLSGHTNWVLAVGFSPDGKRLASGSADNSVKLWDSATGKQITTLSGHTNWVLAVRFSPDGKRLASSSGDRTVKLWDTTTGKEIKTLSGHTNWVLAVNFSPDGKRLVTGSYDNSVKLWDITTGKEIQTLSAHTNAVWSVRFSPDSKLLATASADRTVKLWDTATGKQITTLSGHTSAVWSVRFSPDGKLLATGSADRTVKLWDTATGKQIITLSGHTNEVKTVNFSPDGQLLVSGSDDKTVKLWDTATGKQITTLNGHTNSVLAVSFSPDGKLLASGSKDNTVKLWDTTTNRSITTLSGHTNAVNAVSFSPDGKLLASASADRTVKLWDTATGKLITTLSGHTNAVWSVNFSPNGKLLATGSYDNTVKLWDTTTGKEIKTLSGYTDAVYAVSFSRDGKLLATGTADRTVKLWRLDFDYSLKEGCNFINYYLIPNPNDVDALEIQQDLCKKL